MIKALPTLKPSAMQEPLMMHQELVVLSLCDKTGASKHGAVCSYLISSILTELILQKRITVDDKKRVFVVDQTPTSAPLLDEVLEKIVTANRPKAVSTWLCGLGSATKFYHRTATQLCRKKMLKEEEATVLWFFTQKRYPEINFKISRNLKRRMAKLMFGQVARHNGRTTVLIALAQKSGLLSSNFDKERLGRNKSRIDRVTSGSLFTARAPRSEALPVQACLKVVEAMAQVNAAG